MLIYASTIITDIQQETVGYYTALHMYLNTYSDTQIQVHSYDFESRRLSHRV